MLSCNSEKLLFHVEFFARKGFAKPAIVDVFVGIDKKDNFFVIGPAGSNKMEDIFEEDSTGIAVVSQGFKIARLL